MLPRMKLQEKHPSFFARILKGAVALFLFQDVAFQAAEVVNGHVTAESGDIIVKADEIIPISIPAGVAEGMQMTVSGKGNAARRGGVYGDLLVMIQEEPHPELIRDGNDLLYNLHISIPQAALGTPVEFTTEPPPEFLPYLPKLRQKTEHKGAGSLRVFITQVKSFIIGTDSSHEGASSLKG